MEMLLTNVPPAPYVGHMHNTITSAEAAEQLGVSVRTVHRMVSAGELTPTIKLRGLRGAYLFDADQIARKAVA